jgi:transcriptional regulator
LARVNLDTVDLRAEEGFHIARCNMEEESPDFAVPSPMRRQEIQELMAQALEGTLPRTRDLKPWEPATLNARHVQMVMLKASGLRQSKIAEVLQVTDANVSVALGHPDSQFILARVLSYAAEQVSDVSIRLKAHAPEMLDVALHHARTAKANVASKNAFKLLEMAGYGATQKAEVEHRFSVPADQARCNLCPHCVS